MGLSSSIDYQRDIVQSFDLLNNTTNTYENVIKHGRSSHGLMFPASYISKSNMTFFGGSVQHSNSIQQTLNLDDIEKSTPVGAAESFFQGLLSFSHGDEMAFANAFIKS